MGVYIKGFEMPENCLNCTMRIGVKCYVAPSYVDDTRVAPTVDEVLKGGKPNWCPFVEIPTPHGRLIDEGLYWDILENSFDTDPRFNSDTEIIRCYREAWDITPTVIEAEEAE